MILGLCDTSYISLARQTLPGSQKIRCGLKSEDQVCHDGRRFFVFSGSWQTGRRSCPGAARSSQRALGDLGRRRKSPGEVTEERSRRSEKREEKPRNGRREEEEPEEERGGEGGTGRKEREERKGGQEGHRRNTVRNEGREMLYEFLRR